jgi:hypothetical protein
VSHDCVSNPGLVSGESWMRLPPEVTLESCLRLSPEVSLGRVMTAYHPRYGVGRMVIVSPARGWPRASRDYLSRPRLVSGES